MKKEKEVEKVKKVEKVEPVNPSAVITQGVKTEGVIVEDVKVPETIVESKPAQRVFTEKEKQFMKDNNMDEYIRWFGKP